MVRLSAVIPRQVSTLQSQMGSLTPEMMQQQLKFFNSMTPEQQAEVQQQASNITPEQIAAGASQFQQHSAGRQGYQFQRAQNKKAEGNR